MCGAGDFWVKQAIADAPEELQTRTFQERRALIIFIDKPEEIEPHHTAVGDETVVVAHRVMLAHTREVALATDCDRYLFYAGSIDHADEWDSQYFRKFEQAEGDLGQRIHAAFRQVFAEDHDKVLFISSAYMDLRPSHLTLAYRLMALHEVVIGPANDGGYYLLGLRTDIPALFEGIAWGTDSVLHETCAVLEEQKRSYALGETLYGINISAS